MVDKQQLCKFLVEAKKATYAAGETAKKIVENDQSSTLVFESGDFKYHDNYFGGEPYGGREVVFFKGKPVYIMTYYGLVDAAITDFEPVYKLLQKALRLIPESHPYRGPNEYSEGSLCYKNSFTGEIDNFSGKETISTSDGKEIYRAQYLGGLICLKS